MRFMDNRCLVTIDCGWWIFKERLNTVYRDMYGNGIVWCDEETGKRAPLEIEYQLEDEFNRRKM